MNHRNVQYWRKVLLHPYDLIFSLLTSFKRKYRFHNYVSTMVYKEVLIRIFYKCPLDMMRQNLMYFSQNV